MRIAIPPGIGDVYWSMLKFRSLQKAHPNELMELITLKNPLPRSYQFLELLPFVQSFREEHYLPFHFVKNDGSASRPAGAKEQCPAGWHPEQIPASRDVNGFSYFFWANKHLEDGHRIEEWFPELEMDWDFPIKIPQEDVEAAARIVDRLGKDHFYCIYTSALWGNTGVGNFNPGKWCAHHWMKVVDSMALQFQAPAILLGAEYDADFAAMLDRWRHPYLINLVGKTTFRVALALIYLADAFVGYASGLPILSVHMGTPTVMLWPRSDQPTPLGCWHKKGMQTAWVRPETLAKGTYVPIEFPDATVEGILNPLSSWVGRPEV